MYRGHKGNVLQLLCLGDLLLSLGSDSRLLVWAIGEYAEPKVGSLEPNHAKPRRVQAIPPLHPT